MSKLIPEDLKVKMIQNAYEVLEGRSEDHPPEVMLTAGKAVWLISELDPFYDDIAFGLRDLGMGCPELDCDSITEL